MSDLGPKYVQWPHTRIRRELDVHRGIPSRFVYQLEYDVDLATGNLNVNDWKQVARFDYDIDGQHDIQEEGLHLDVYRDGRKYRRTWDFPNIPVRDAPDFCESYLLKNAEALLARFENWHGIKGYWTIRYLPG